MPYMEITQYNNRRWYNSEGQLHRDNGPAVECNNGGKVWFVNGKRHRLNGPAIEWSNGTKSWWINDKKYTEEEYKEIMKCLS